MVENEQEQVDNEQNSENKIFTVEKIGNSQIVTYWLIEPIEGTKKYIDLLNTINKLNSQDEINIHINCPGGNCDTAFQIYDALKKTQGKVNIFGDGLIASAATFIMMCGDTITLSPHTYVMCHGYTWGVWGKCNEVESEHKFVEPWMKRQFADVYRGFLTDAEIELLLGGKDYWFDSTEATARIEVAKEKENRVSDRINILIERYKELLEKDIENSFDKETGELDEDSIKEQEKRLLEMEQRIISLKNKKGSVTKTKKTKSKPKKK